MDQLGGPMGESITVPRWLLVAGGIGLASLLSTSAFLLGRVTAPPPQPVVLPPPETIQAVVNTHDRTPAAPTPEPEDVAAPPLASEAPHATPSRRSTRPATPVSSEPPHYQDTRRYLKTLSKMSERTSNFSTDAFLSQALAGDVSGLDQLIADHRKRIQEIDNLSPPPPCEAHHTALRKLAADGLLVMEQLRTGITRGDVQALMALQPTALRLEQQGAAIEAMEAGLQKTYGPI